MKSEERKTRTKRDSKASALPAIENEQAVIAPQVVGPSVEPEHAPVQPAPRAPLPLHSFGAGVTCARCGHIVGSVYAHHVQEAQKGLGVCAECIGKADKD